jgi:predicted peptidase
MLFLHGRGESRGPVSAVKKWGPPRLIERGENFPFLVASPQCPEAESWPQPQQQTLLLGLLDHLAKTYKVDESKVYLTGLSMGGFGAWRLAADHPERFAAMVPICGGGKVEDAEKLKSLPIWVFHGVADPTVPVQRSTEMVEAIKKAGGTNIRFTTLEHIGHNSWEAAYACPELYQWLDKQVAQKAGAHAQ